MFDTLIALLKIAGDFKAPADRDQHKMYVLVLFIDNFVDLRMPEHHYTVLVN